MITDFSFLDTGLQQARTGDGGSAARESTDGAGGAFAAVFGPMAQDGVGKSGSETGGGATANPRGGAPGAASSAAAAVETASPGGAADADSIGARLSASPTHDADPAPPISPGSPPSSFTPAVATTGKNLPPGGNALHAEAARNATADTTPVAPGGSHPGRSDAVSVTASDAGTATTPRGGATGTPGTPDTTGAPLMRQAGTDTRTGNSAVASLTSGRAHAEPPAPGSSPSTAASQLAAPALPASGGRSGGDGSVPPGVDSGVSRLAGNAALEPGPEASAVKDNPSTAWTVSGTSDPLPATAGPALRGAADTAEHEPGTGHGQSDTGLRPGFSPVGRQSVATPTSVAAESGAEAPIAGPREAGTVPLQGGESLDRSRPANAGGDASLLFDGARAAAQADPATAELRPAELRPAELRPAELRPAELRFPDRPLLDQPAFEQTAADRGARQVMQQFAGQPGWGDEIHARLQWLSRHGLQRAELQLHPAELGSIDVRISAEQDQTSVVFVAANRTARELLEAELPRLRELFSQAGIELGQAEVRDRETGEQRQLASGRGNYDGDLNSGIKRGREDADTVEAELKLSAAGEHGVRGVIDYYI